MGVAIVRRYRVVFALAAVLAGVLLSLPAGALSSKRASITLVVTPSNIQVKDSAVFTICVQGASKGSNALLQERVKNAWHTLSKVSFNTTSCPVRTYFESSPGELLFRATLLHMGKKVATSKIGTLYVYMTLTFSAMCSITTQPIYGGPVSFNDPVNFCAPRAVQIGGKAFTATIEDQQMTVSPGSDDLVDIGANTSCRSISVNVGVTDNGDGGEGANVALAQSGAKPDVLAVNDNGTSSVTWPLTGSSWTLGGWTDTGQEFIWLDGSVDCWTANGSR
jgi:hypothetical protein